MEKHFLDATVLTPEEEREAQHQSFVRQAQEYLSVKEAAALMGISVRSAYAYVASGKLVTVQMGSHIHIQAASARAYQRKGAGRPRARTPIWRRPVFQNLPHLLSITVQMQEGKSEDLEPRLEAVRQHGRHFFTGTVARYVVRDLTDSKMVQIVLIWRQQTLPSEAERQATLLAFQAELADILDWDTARITGGLAVLSA